MADYNRTVWKDHIKDQNENVIQQGTPVSAQNLNNIENQIVILSAKENNLAELVREAIPSGFTTLSDLDYTYMSTNPNKIKLSSDSVAYVNGYKVTIPAGTVITLDAPPTLGTRDDLVFLECWKQTDSNGSISWNYRIRVVDGVDFNLLSVDGMGATGNGSYHYIAPDTFYGISAQGGNLSPCPLDNTSSTTRLNSAFRRADYSSYRVADDIGLFVCGLGNTGSRTALGTTDGYVYAIPMFRVKRRNVGGYSVNNGNGSSLYMADTINTNLVNRQLVYGDTAQFTCTTQSFYDALEVGSILRIAATQIVKVISKDGNKNITIMSVSTGGISLASYTFKNLGKRPDLLLADIIDTRDILDLRHQVSLTGFNFQQLLEDNFDRLLRGELQTNAKTSMLKTYHGIAKTPIDANHVFYASFYGANNPEVGNIFTGDLSTIPYKPMPTGLGRYVDGASYTASSVLNQDLGSTGTVEFWIDFGSLVNSSSEQSEGGILNLYQPPTSSSDKSLFIRYSPSTGLLTVNLMDRNTTFAVDKKLSHIRVAWSNGLMCIYIDGRFKASRTLTIIPSGLNTLLLGKTYNATGTTGLYKAKFYISDLCISNIDRGSTFATLPQDFIDGYARIDKAFNTQRKVFSDALTSETLTAQVKATGSNNKEITTAQATGGVWATNDTLKIKGLGGEIITGVIDADTALARTTQLIVSTNTIYVDDVSKFVVGDVVNFHYVTTLEKVLTGRTITAIDAINKTVTVDGAVINDTINYFYLLETTASSSAPAVKTAITGQAQAGASTTITLPATFNPTDDVYNGLTITITGGTGAGQVRTISDYVGSTKVATVSSAWATNPDSTSIFNISGVTVAGTWSSLSTNEATFTLGTLYALATQDLWVTYSLNEVAGQGGISEVLTTVLAGESNGKKLTVNPSAHVKDDFAGKVAGDTTVCPNIRKAVASVSSLQAPSAFGEMAQASYDLSKTLDGNSSSTSNSVSGNIAQQLFSFNLIRILEDKFGTLPCPSDTASKIAWLKANINKITCNWWGYGVCPSGNKAYLLPWNVVNNAYSTSVASNTASTPSNIIYNTDSSASGRIIDDNGYINFLAYTDASDGVTASTVYTDYVNIEILLNTTTGYDILAPENSRRDDGLSNLLLVRKETKEIQTLFPKSNTSGIVTYGDYVPYQGLSVSTGIVKATDSNIFVTTAGTGGYKGYTEIAYMDYLYKLLGNNIPLYLCVNDEIAYQLTKTNYSNSMFIPIVSYYSGRNKNYIGSSVSSLTTNYVEISNIKSNSYYYVYKILKYISGQLYMTIRAKSSSGSVYDYDFLLSSKPLIK